jgi:HlyD family secretion protein
MAQARSYKIWYLLTAVFLLGGVGYYLYKREASPEIELTTTTITRADVIQSVTASGDLQPVVTVDVSSQISGLISAVLVDYNSTVKKGDLLAQIDPATYQSRLNQAKAQLANTRANHTLVKLNAERTRILFGKQLVSQQELDQAEAQLAQAEAQLQIQQASVDNAAVDLARCNIYTPIDGIVMDRLTDVGKTVAASLNAPTLFTIANDLSKMQINAAVSEADIGSVEVGQTVNFTVDAFPSTQFRGSVSMIRNSPKTQQNVVVYATIIDVSNADLKLKPGMTANVSIVVARRNEAVRLANAALRVRIPEGVNVNTAPGPDGKTAPAKPALSDEQLRKIRRELMAEAGFTPGSGRPSPEVLAKVQELAKARGIELPAFGSRGGNTGAPVSRTVYRLVKPDPKKPVIEAVTVKLGINDGSGTEVLEGLQEGDVVLTGISIPSAKTAGASASPFGPPAGGFGQRR